MVVVSWQERPFDARWITSEWSLVEAHIDPQELMLRVKQESFRTLSPAVQFVLPILWFEILNDLDYLSEYIDQVTNLLNERFVVKTSTSNQGVQEKSVITFFAVPHIVDDWRKKVMLIAGVSDDVMQVSTKVMQDHMTSVNNTLLHQGQHILPNVVEPKVLTRSDFWDVTL